jgi:hypothetical protein
VFAIPAWRILVAWFLVRTASVPVTISFLFSPVTILVAELS